jgi:hypothetical protein
VQELRFVAVSEDGSYAVLAVPGRSGRYILPIDERLRAVALGQTSRLAQYEIEVESPLRPKEIQARIRAGETAEEIADAAGIPVERVRWFEGPVLAERAYIAEQAQAGSVRRAGDSSGPGPRLGEIVTARLTAAGTDPADGQWDSRKRGDGSWQVSLTFPSGGRLHVAEWVFDPRRRHVMPDDDNAARLSLPESELPPEPVSVPGEATVTPIASRLGAAAGMGGGAYTAGPAVSRFRPDRSVLPDRSLGVDRSLADRPAAPAASSASSSPAGPATPAASAHEHHAAAERPQAPSRHASQDRPDYQDHRGGGYAEFPESAPYRFAEPAPEPAAGRDLAQEPSAYHPPAESHGQHVAGAGRGYDDPAPAAYRAQADEPGYREAPAEPRAYPEPAAYSDQVPRQPAFHDAEPEPAAHHAQAPAPAPTAPASAAPGSAAPASAAPASAAPAAAATGAPVFEDPERGRPTPSRPVVFEDPEPAFPGKPAAIATPEPETARVRVPAPEPVAARTESPAAAAQPGTSEAGAQPGAATPPVAAPAAPAAVPAAVTSVPPATAAHDMPTVSAPASAPATAPEPSAPAAAAADPAAEPATEDGANRPRPGSKKTAKGRRSSVPSWDEIMLGSSRPRD